MSNPSDFTTVFTRRIDPVFDIDSKRRRHVGFDGYLDGVRRVFCAGNYAAAENALDEIAYTQLVNERDLDAEADAYAAEDADLDALIAEITTDYPDTDETEATVVALGLQPALDAYADQWDDWAARQWSAGMAERMAQ